MGRKCLECDSEILGRADKKFCDDSCRNAYHNRNNRTESRYVRSINRILSNNHRILHELNPGDKSKTHRNKLEKKGFNFNFFTSTYTTKAGSVYYFCYEKGYLPLDNDWFALVTNSDMT